jgi:hypothetical protein
VRPLAVLVLVASLPAAADPVTQMAPAWRDDGAGAKLVPVRGRLAMFDEQGVTMVDPRDGYHAQHLLLSLSGKLIDAAATPTALVAAAEHGVVAFDIPNDDAEEAHERWHVPLDRVMARSVSIAADDDRVVIIGDRDLDPQIAVFRMSDGAVVWHTTLPRSWTIRLVELRGPRILLAGNSDTHDDARPTAFAVQLEATTGRTSWSYHGPEASSFSADALHLAIARDGALVAIDRGSGRAVETELPDQIDPKVHAAEGIAYVAGRRSGDTGGFVTAIGLADRHVRWRRRLRPLADTTFAITPRAVYLQDDSFAIVALLRGSGDLAWTWSRPALERLTGDAATERVFASTDGHVVAFAPALAAPAAETAVVVGHVIGECTASSDRPIRVAGVTTTTDHEGRFRVTVTGRGDVAIVDVEDDNPLASFSLIGRRRYNVGAFRVGACGD